MDSSSIKDFNQNESSHHDSSPSTNYSVNQINKANLDNKTTLAHASSEATQHNNPIYIPNRRKSSQFFNHSSNFLPIITSMQPIDESNSTESNLTRYTSNRSFETQRASTSSLASLPSSISVNNSIECKNERWLSKGSSFLKSHLNLQASKKYSPSKADWKSRNSVYDSGTGSFKYLASCGLPQHYTTTSSTRNLDDVDDNFLNTKANSNFIKSFSFNNFNHFRKYSVDANLASLATLTASNRSVSNRKRFSQVFASSTSLKIGSGKNSNIKLRRGSSPFFGFYEDPNTRSLKKSPSIEKQESASSTRADGSNAAKSFSKLQKLTLLCILTVSFCSYCSMSILAPFFPRKAEEKGLTETQSGFVFSIFALISVIFSPFLGKLIPVFGAKLLILFGILLGGICNLLFGLVEEVQNPTLFFVLCVGIRIFESFGTCCHATASYTYIIKLFPNSIGFVFGLTETFVGLGLCLGPAIGSLLYAIGGYKLPFYVFGSIVLLCFPFNWYFLENINHGDPIGEDHGSLSSGSMNDIETSYCRLLKVPKIAVICLMIVVVGLAHSYLEPTLEPFLRSTFGMKQEIIGLFFLIESIAYAVSTPVVGYVATRTHNKFMIMLVGSLLTLVGLFIVGPSPFIYFAKPSLWLSTVGLILMSFGIGVSTIPTFEALFFYSMKSGFRDDIQTYSKVSGLWSSLFSLGEFIGPLLGGWALSKVNFAYASTIIGFITVGIANDEPDDDDDIDDLANVRSEEKLKTIAGELIAKSNDLEILNQLSTTTGTMNSK